MQRSAQVMLQQAEVDRLTALTQFKEVKAPFDGTIVQRQHRHRKSGDGGQHRQHDVALSAFRKTIRCASSSMRPQSVARAAHEAGRKRRDHQPATSPICDLKAKSREPRKRSIRRSRTIRVEIDVPNTDRSLVPGMYVQARFRTDGRRRDPGSGGRAAVPVRRPASRRRRRQGRRSLQGRHDRQRRWQRRRDRLRPRGWRQGRAQSQQPDRGRPNGQGEPD